jgi:hypothetical protein
MIRRPPPRPAGRPEGRHVLPEHRHGTQRPHAPGATRLRHSACASEIRTGQQLRHCSEFLSRFARWMPAAGTIVPGGILAPDRVAWIRRTAAGCFVSIVSKVVAIVIVRIEPSLLANLSIFTFRCFCRGDTRAARQHQHTDSQCNPEHRGLLEFPRSPTRVFA